MRDLSHDVTGGVVGGTPRGRGNTHVFLRLLTYAQKMDISIYSAPKKFYGSNKYFYRLSKKNTHVLLLVGGNGGDVTRSVSRRVDVHVVVAERVEANLVVRAAFSLLGQPRAAPRLNLLDLGLDIYGWKVTRFFFTFSRLAKPQKDGLAAVIPCQLTLVCGSKRHGRLSREKLEEKRKRHELLVFVCHWAPIGIKSLRMRLLTRRARSEFSVPILVRGSKHLCACARAFAAIITVFSLFSCTARSHGCFSGSVVSCFNYSSMKYVFSLSLSLSGGQS